jgi:hypothetical protein
VAWLDADAADLALIEGVERAAAEWQCNGRLDAWLVHWDDRLAAAATLVASGVYRDRLGERGTEYLERCKQREAKVKGEAEAAAARARVQAQRLEALEMHRDDQVRHDEVIISEIEERSNRSFIGGVIFLSAVCLFWYLGGFSNKEATKVLPEINVGNNNYYPFEKVLYYECSMLIDRNERLDCMTKAFKQAHADLAQ